MTDDDLTTVPHERLVEMLREKRKAEADVRARLREVEGERDALSATVTAWQGEKLQDAARAAKVAETALGDLPQYVPLVSVLADDGRFDAEKATAAFEALKETRPHLFDVPRTAARSTDGGPGPLGGSATPPAASWSDVLAPE